MIEGLFQPVHLLLIAAIFLIVFGPGKLAGVGGALGKSVHDFKESIQNEDEESAAIAAHPSVETSVAPTGLSTAASGEAMRSSDL